MLHSQGNLVGGPPLVWRTRDAPSSVLVSFSNSHFICMLFMFIYSQHILFYCSLCLCHVNQISVIHVQLLETPMFYMDLIFVFSPCLVLSCMPQIKCTCIYIMIIWMFMMFCFDDSCFVLISMLNAMIIRAMICIITLIACGFT